MAEVKKYLDYTTGLPTLVEEIKKADAKVLSDAKAYADGLAVNYDAAGAAATALSDAKKYTDDQIAEKADAKGSAAAVDTKLTAEVERATGKENELASSIAEVKDTADNNKVSIETINNAETGILATAKKYTDDEVTKVQGAVDALDTFAGELPESSNAETLVEYINEKTANIASDATVSALADRVTQAETDIDALEADHLVKADKTELEGKITTAQGAADAAKAHSEGVASDLAEAVETLENADTAQVGRIATLEEQIKGLSGAMHFKGVETEIPTDLSGYVEGDVIIVGEKEYVFNGTAFVEFGDVSAEGERIGAVEDRLEVIEPKVSTLEGEMDAVQAAVATKAEAQALTDEIKAREDADTDLDERLQAVEAKFGEGEGNVESQIETAKQAAIDAAAVDAKAKADQALVDAKKYADDEDAKIEARVDALEAIDHEHANKDLLDTYTQTEANLADAVAKKHEHANKEILDGINSEKVAAWDASEKNAKGYADGLNTAMTSKVDAVIADVAENTEAIALKAEKTALDSAVERIAANETAIAANTSAINGFVAISAEEVRAYFA